MDILVIDDEVSRTRWFQDTLEPAGHQLRLAHTPEDALDQLHELKFDLVFFDHDLGSKEWNGSKLAYHVFMHPKRYMRPDAIWIHTSNPNGAENIAAKCRSAGVRFGIGAFESFMKQPNSLLKAIAELMASRSCQVQTILSVV